MEAAVCAIDTESVERQQFREARREYEGRRQRPDRLCGLGGTGIRGCRDGQERLCPDRFLHSLLRTCVFALHVPGHPVGWPDAPLTALRQNPELFSGRT